MKQPFLWCYFLVVTFTSFKASAKDNWSCQELGAPLGSICTYMQRCPEGFRNSVWYTGCSSGQRCCIKKPPTISTVAKQKKGRSCKEQGGPLGGICSQMERCPIGWRRVFYDRGCKKGQKCCIEKDYP